MGPPNIEPTAARARGISRMLKLISSRMMVSDPTATGATSKRMPSVAGSGAAAGSSGGATAIAGACLRARLGMMPMARPTYRLGRLPPQHTNMSCCERATRSLLCVSRARSVGQQSCDLSLMCLYHQVRLLHRSCTCTPDCTPASGLAGNTGSVSRQRAGRKRRGRGRWLL